MPDNNTYEGYHEPGHDPRLDWGRAALIATLDEALMERDQNKRITAESDEELRALMRAYCAMSSRVQGFLYGSFRVIRDVSKPYGEQELWRRPVEDCSDETFYEQCCIERMRLALAEMRTRGGR